MSKEKKKSPEIIERIRAAPKPKKKRPTTT
jgi:hypothetical protein